MDFYDYLILGFYFAFMVGIGFLFRSFNKDISDYFRGGGSMLWWMVGASTLMGNLSAWSFTGGASKVYEAGIIYLAIVSCGLISGLLVYFFTCYRFRQMRVMTSVEAIRRRFGPTNEQFYVWLQLPAGLVAGAVGLNTLGVFISSVFGTNLLVTVIVVGVIVIFVASAGGVWAVVAGDFVQMLVMLLVVAVAAFLALQQPEIGGLGGLFHKLPSSHFDLSYLSQPKIVTLWFCALVLQTVLLANDLSAGAARFMSVKDGVHARRAALMALILNQVFPLLLFIPPLTAVIIYPNIAEKFPHLSHPSEAAYVAICMKTMPHGLLGLMVSGLFATAMASMDVGLNRNTGVFIKNFYSAVLRPNASQKELLLASRFFTAVFGVLIVGGGVYIALFRSTNLFDLSLMIGSLIGVPLVVPLAWGLFLRNTPSWTAWSTALVGFAVAGLAKWVIGANLYLWFTGEAITSLRPQEITDIKFSTTVILVGLIGSAWFFFTMLFASRAPKAYKEQVDAFFKDMVTPIDPVAEHIVYDDGRQYRVIGKLCLLYGSAMMAGMLIPNHLEGRLCFGFVGTVLLFIGWLLYRNYQKGMGKTVEVPLKEVQSARGAIRAPGTPATTYDDN
jgi:SSS family solute:Na+ symporter